jgi:hypothetical protein
MQYSAVVLVIVAACSANAAAPAPSTAPSYDEWKEAKSAEANSAEAKAAKEAKMAAVNKVVAMLEDLQKQVLEEGEAEAKTYNTFACWVKTTMTEKQEAIQKGKDDKASLSAAITKLASTRKDLDTKIGALEKDIESAQSEMKKATATSNAALAEYEVNEADMSSAVAALKGAIKELKSSKSPSLLQLQGISKTVRQALIMADALGLDAPGLSMLQGDAPPVEMENYKFHSDSIIETLETLLKEFTTEKNTLDADEVKRAQAYHMLMQEKTDLVKAKTVELDDRQQQKAEAQEDLAANSQELSTVSATLLDDMDYLKEVYEISSAKAKTWDQRSKVRADELSALTAATQIVKDQVAKKTQSATIRFAEMGVSVRMANAVASSDDAMEAIEERAEETDDDASPMGFLQRLQISSHKPSSDSNAIAGRQAVVQLLRNKGQQLKSKLLSSLAVEVAGQQAADVFAKVKVLIQELIERLLAEAANEATHKGWCTKAIKDAEQKREYASEDIATLNAALADDEATLDKLKEEIGVLDTEIKDLKAGRTEAEKIRKEEKAENKKTVTEAEAGMSAVQEAIKILTRFYATAAKETVDLSLAQGPKDDMPDAGFEGGEAYTGVGGVEGGVVGMLEVIESDFVRTIKETEKAEVQGEEEHLAYMTESGKSLAEKEMARGETGKYKDATEIKLEKDGESLKAQVTILKTSIEELLELQPACVDTGMSYADRVAAKEQEVEALKKALCILNAFASYGPDGLADAC